MYITVPSKNLEYNLAKTFKLNTHNPPNSRRDRVSLDSGFESSLQQNRRIRTVRDTALV